MTQKALLFKEALTHFNRVGGQFARYYGIDYLSYLTGVTTPAGVKKALEEMRFDVEQEQITRRIEEREAREEAKRKEEEQLAQMEIDNIKYQIESLIYSAQSGYAKDDIRQSVNVILEIIDSSVEKYGAVTAVEWLRPWALTASDRLERLACAIYDSDYNTNNFWYRVDRAGDMGRNNYINDMQTFAASMGVACPPLYFV